MPETNQCVSLLFVFIALVKAYRLEYKNPNLLQYANEIERTEGGKIRKFKREIERDWERSERLERLREIERN